MLAAVTTTPAGFSFFTEDDSMLVLTRHEGESIRLGDGVKITVLSSENGRIRLGIEAPASLRVDRREVSDQLAADDEEETSISDLFSAHPR